MDDAEIWKVIEKSARPSHSGTFVMLELGAFDVSNVRAVERFMGSDPWAYYMFEPLPKNIDKIKRQGIPTQVKLVEKAIGHFNGRGSFYTSAAGENEWDYSSSIRKPKDHLHLWPWVTFPGIIEVEVTTLDAFSNEVSLPTIDFLWSDIQGAEGDMIVGGSETIKRVRYMLLELYEPEIYEGTKTLTEVRKILKADWEELGNSSDNYLFRNKRF